INLEQSGPVCRLHVRGADLKGTSSGGDLAEPCGAPQIDIQGDRPKPPSLEHGGLLVNMGRSGMVLGHRSRHPLEDVQSVEEERRATLRNSVDLGFAITRRKALEKRAQAEGLTRAALT